MNRYVFLKVASFAENHTSPVSSSIVDQLVNKTLKPSKYSTTHPTRLWLPSGSISRNV